jgi:hypothetical protein
MLYISVILFKKIRKILMPKLENKLNLPEPFPTIVRSMISWFPQPERYSVTSLLAPPLTRTLKIEYWDDLVVDVKDYLYMLDGIALDEYLEKWTIQMDDVVVQHKMEVPFVVEGNKVVVVGKTDLIRFDDQHVDIEDWKRTTVNIKTQKERLFEYQFQLNCYKYMWLNIHGIPVRNLWLNPYYRDWKKMQAYFGSHPKGQFEQVRMESWTPEKTESLIRERLLDHTLHPRRECTPEEKWQTPTTYAVMKKGRKSALRVLDSYKEAETWCKSIGHVIDTKGISIEVRLGGCNKCKFYCDVASVCPFYEGEVA